MAFKKITGSYWKRAGAAEVFKFSFYLAIPILTSIVYANPDLMHKLVRYMKFIEYPERKVKLEDLYEKKNSP